MSSECQHGRTKLPQATSAHRAPLSKAVPVTFPNKPHSVKLLPWRLTERIPAVPRMRERLVIRPTDRLPSRSQELNSPKIRVARVRVPCSFMVMDTNGLGQPGSGCVPVPYRLGVRQSHAARGGNGTANGNDRQNNSVTTFYAPDPFAACESSPGGGSRSHSMRSPPSARRY